MFFHVNTPEVEIKTLHITQIGAPGVHSFSFPFCPASSGSANARGLRTEGIFRRMKARYAIPTHKIHLAGATANTSAQERYNMKFAFRTNDIFLVDCG